MQISLLVLLLCASTFAAGGGGGGGDWINQYTHKDGTAPAPRKTPPPVSVPTPAAVPEYGLTTPATPHWLFHMPDVSRSLEVAVTAVQQTDDRGHRLIWTWISKYPILQFTAIILLSGAILTLLQWWLRRCRVVRTT